MERRVINTDETVEDRQLEPKIRPQTLDDYIGQSKLKEMLKIYIQAAKNRGESLDHCLFYGPPGLGKTTISNIIANEPGVNIKVTSGPAIEKPGEIAAILNGLSEGDVLFVDEIKEEYFGHDIFLLPLQSIPEHSHVAQKIDASVCQDRWTGQKFDKELPAKMESWLVRNGWVYSFSEVGEPNLDKFPEAKANLSALLYDHKADKPTLLKSLHVEKWIPDGIAHKLPKTGSWHFMMGGTEGAIVTEFANFHDSSCNRYTVPNVGF